MTGPLLGKSSKATCAAVGLALAAMLCVDTRLEAQTETKTKAKSEVKAKAKAKVEEKKEATPPLDLNKATAEQMVETLPGVGEATAKKIVEGRPYKKVDDLEKAGVPARTIEGIRSMVVVKEAPEEKAKAKAKAKAEMVKGEPAKGADSAAVVDLNSGNLEALETLPGVGAVTAKAIVAGRPFKSVDDLEKIKGLGKAKIDALRPLVKVEPPVETVEAEAPAAKKGESSKKTETATSPKRAMEKVADKKAAAAAAPALKAGETVNINTASKDKLDALPGIGPVKAQAILDARPFKTKEDIMKVKGIKEGEFGKIKDIITVD